MKVAVDVCIGLRGIALLRAAGHEVVVVAMHGERDEDWFARAKGAKAEIVIAADRDISVLCYDSRVPFFRVSQHRTGVDNAKRFIRHVLRTAA